MKKIIIINGFHSGKDTFVKFANEFAEVVNYSYVDFTRNMYLDSGIDISGKTDSDRILLAQTNNLLETWGDIPFKDVCDISNDFLDNKIDGDILFLHIRDTAAISRFVAELGAKTTIKTLLIRRNNGLNTPTPEDAGIENYSYDYYIDNNGTLKELREKAETFVLSLYAEGI